METDRSFKKHVPCWQRNDPRVTSMAKKLATKVGFMRKPQ